MMPSLVLIGIPRVRWMPPVPIPLFPLWPLALVCLGIARLLDGDRPEEAARLRAAMHVFRELRGLAIDMETANQKRVRIWFV